MRSFIVFIIVALTSNIAFANSNSPTNCNGKDSCNTENYYDTESHANANGEGHAYASGGDAYQGQLQGQLQGQGQTQGQVGINTADQSFKATNTSVTTDINSSSNKGLNLQGQSAVGEVDSHDTVTVEGDTVINKEATIPVNTAAPVFAGSCAQGLSVQFGNTGASVGSGNPVCDFMSVAGGYIAAGDRDTALKVLDQARKAAESRYNFSWWRSILTFGLF